MGAWIYVFDHPWFALTNDQGKFSIDNVPAGQHRLHVRQPDARLERDLELEILPGKSVAVDLEFTHKDLPPE